MEVFRNLLVSATAERMAALVAEMEKAMPAGWKRDSAAEVRTTAFLVASKRIAYCFACEKENERPAALLILAQRDPATFHVTNIVPVERHQFDRREYNTILEDFYQRVFDAAARKANVMHELTDADAGLEHWMDAETADLLRHFSAAANKGTGSSHPADRARWNAFVISAHDTGSQFDSSTLVRWLVEIEEWSPEVAEQLAVEYEYGRELLAYAGQVA